MKVYDSNNLRNVAILGYSGCGKSNLIDALAYTTNISNKMPKISDKVNMTYSIGLSPIEYNNVKYNLLDTPGYFDFSGEVISSLRASDVAIIVIDATSPIQVGTEKSLELTEHMPKIMFINKIDNEKARYKDAIEMLRKKYDNKIAPMISPIYKDKKFVKLHNILENLDDDLDGEFKEQVSSVKEALMEHIAETDDEVLDKYFNGEELTPEEILKTIESYIEPNYIKYEEPLKALVFKTIVDPFVGKMSYIKVVQGKLKKDSEVINLNKDVREKISNLYTMKMGELEEVDCANAGDIVVVTKINSLKTGNTLASSSKEELLDEINLPKSQIYYAVVHKNKSEEDKIGLVLNKISEEDPTIHWYRNPETKQTLVGGQGELHINTVKNKMKEKFGVDVDLEDIKVAYRETIKGTSNVQGKHKKQSGGHGQYGDVKPDQMMILSFQKKYLVGLYQNHIYQQ